MSDAPFTRVAPHDPWLSQGDIFSRIMIVRLGVESGVATGGVDRGPALLVSHGCAIDKKAKDGSSDLEYLTFLPLQSVAVLDENRAANLRALKDELGPFNALYLGEVPSLGESYAMLTEPYTIPADFLQPTLTTFTAADLGETTDDERIVPSMGDTRVGRLDHPGRTIWARKWIAQWTRAKASADQVSQAVQ